MCFSALSPLHVALRIFHEVAAIEGARERVGKRHLSALGHHALESVLERQDSLRCFEPGQELSGRSLLAYVFVRAGLEAFNDVAFLIENRPDDDVYIAGVLLCANSAAAFPSMPSRHGGVG